MCQLSAEAWRAVPEASEFEGIGPHIQRAYAIVASAPGYRYISVAG